MGADLGGSQIVDDTIVHFFPPCIKAITLCQCKQVTDEALRGLSTHLQHLELPGCESLTDRGLSFIPPSVRYLNLGGCTGVTDNGKQHHYQQFLTMYCVVTVKLARMSSAR